MGIWPGVVFGVPFSLGVSGLHSQLSRAFDVQTDAGTAAFAAVSGH